MNGYQYEKLCAEFLRGIGFRNITVTPGSGDQGVDITATKGGKKYGIQCKYYTGTVGNKAVQEVYAGAAYYGCDTAMVITNSTFSKSAVQLASRLNVMLREKIDTAAIPLYRNNEQNKKERLELEDKIRELRTTLERGHTTQLFQQKCKELHELETKRDSMSSTYEDKLREFKTNYQKEQEQYQKSILEFDTKIEAKDNQIRQAHAELNRISFFSFKKKNEKKDIIFSLEEEKCSLQSQRRDLVAASYENARSYHSSIKKLDTDKALIEEKIAQCKKCIEEESPENQRRRLYKLESQLTHLITGI